MSKRWIEVPTPVGWHKERLFVDDDGEVFCSVTKNSANSTWKAWRRGTGIGEFLTEEMAKKRAEEKA